MGASHELASFEPGQGPHRVLVDSIRYGFADPPELDLSDDEAAMASFIARYEFAPIEFAEEVLGIARLDEWSKDVLCDIAAGERLITIRSGHGVGKTFTLAIASLWYLCVKFRCKVVATAPTQGQLFDSYLAEVKSMFLRLPETVQAIFEVKSDRIEHRAFRDDCFLTAVTSSADRPEALQGRHSDNVLLIIDEASGVPDAVYKAATGSMNGPNRCMVLASNPTRLIGRFARSHLKAGYREQYRRYHVGAHNSTRMTEAFKLEIIREYGEDSDEFRIRVLGDFAKADADSYIAADLIEDAMTREIAEDWQANEIWAIDPARMGKDGSAFGKRKGPKVRQIKVKYKLDTMALVGWIKAEWDECKPHQRPKLILVDSIGIGAGVADRLREMDLPVKEINASESPANPMSKAVRLRDEMFLKTKQVLQERRVSIEEDEDVVQDLSSPRGDYTSDGRLKIESKADVKKRLGRSPDKGDVVCMLLGGVDAAAIYGAAPYSGFRSGPANEPIKRRVGVLNSTRVDRRH